MRTWSSNSAWLLLDYESDAILCRDRAHAQRLGELYEQLLESSQLTKAQAQRVIRRAAAASGS